MHANLVSICIPVFNGEQYLHEALESVLRQTYRPLEIVVSDDCSQDSSLKIIDSFVHKTDIPIRVYRHTPSGIGANWNNCIRCAMGQYIKFLFQDDLLKNNCISEMMAIAKLDPTIGLVFSRRQVLGEPNNLEHEFWAQKLGLLHSGWENLEEINYGINLLKSKTLLDFPANKIGEPTATLLKREVFQRVGLFSETYQQSLDYEMYYRLMPYFKVGFIDKELAIFRLHEKQASAVNKLSGNSEEELTEVKRVLFYQSLYAYLSVDVKIKLLKEFHPLFKPFRIFYSIRRWVRKVMDVPR